tara:strand:- start:493 stop:2124 length:1632 start_codon:yes stop_codon:yes gene_type:complete
MDNNTTNMMSRAEVAKYVIGLKDAQAGFLGFVKMMYPEWSLPDFQLELVDVLDKLEKNSLGCDNVLITMPPRHAKSTFGTILFPSWFMGRDPKRQVMSSSYNSQLAMDFGRQIRSIVEDKKISQVFPSFVLSQDSRAADVWRTDVGGTYYGVGVGGTTSGRPANLLIVDDPIKSREDAESMTQRNKTWNYYTSALATRLQPLPDGTPPKQIIILTRWHPDDLAGRLMQTADWGEGRWKHINFPAVGVSKGKKISKVDLPEGHPQKMEPGSLHKVTASKRHIYEEEEHALWPERFPLEDLKRRERLNKREFASLYQQRPYIEGGNLIKSEWWRFYPEDLKPENFMSVVIGVDTAFKKTETSDYSAFVIGGLDRNGDIYIIDVMRGKWDFPELKQRLIQLNNRWRGKALRAIYVEDKASGQSVVQELKRQSGMSIIPYKVVHDKVSRVSAILPLIQGGRVFLPENAKWIDDFMDETVTFPNGMYDDQVDAMTITIDVLSRTSMSPEMFEMMTDTSQSLNSLHDSLGSSLRERVNKDIPKFSGWGI